MTATRRASDRRRLVLHVYGVPKPKGSLRHVGRGRLVEQVDGSTAWKEHVRAEAETAARAVGWERLDGVPVRARLVFVVPRPKSAPKSRRWPTTRSSGDLDKLVRNMLDALASQRGVGGVIGDDSQVVELTTSKVYAEPGEGQAVELGPGVHVELVEMFPELVGG